jgi:hypothetical protein
MAGIAKKQGFDAIIIGGIQDHVRDYAFDAR